MSEMADVILAHSSASYECDYDGLGNNGIWCDMCGEGEDNPGEPEDGWLAKHQASALSAAGFGPVQAARAEWGVEYRGVTVYESEAEARRQLAFAQMDVPALLVKREVTEWRAVAERGEG